jgi:hypothetical protein
MVWIKAAGDRIINLETILSIRWTYRNGSITCQHTDIDIKNSSKAILEIYVKLAEGEFLIYNRKIYEDVEKLGTVEYNKTVAEYRKDLSVPEISSDEPEDIVKNAIAINFVNKILLCVSEAKKEEIVNFYKVFGTRKEL